MAEPELAWRDKDGPVLEIGNADNHAPRATTGRTIFIVSKKYGVFGCISIAERMLFFGISIL